MQLPPSRFPPVARGMAQTSYLRNRVLMGWRKRFDDLVQHVRLGFPADQVGIAFFAMVVNLIGLIVLSVFYQKGYGWTTLGIGLQDGANHALGILAAIHRDQLHARPDAGDIGR